MKRISSLLALGFLSLGLATSATAQTKVTQLVIQNSTGTTKLSQTSGGLDVNNRLILHCTTTPTNTVTLIVPSTSGMGNANFMFPTSGGTLLTTTANDVNGDAMIAAINEGTTQIDAARLDLSGLDLGGVSTVAAGDLTLNITTLGDAVTASLNLANPNSWSATQTLPVTLAQGNALINSINAGTTPLTGYVTSSGLTTILGDYVTNAFLTNNYTSTTNMHAAIQAAVAGGSAGNYTDTTFAYNADVTLTTSDLSKYTAWMLTPNGPRSLSLGNGSAVGQLLTFVNVVPNTGNHTITIADASNVSVPGTSVTIARNDVISFIWSGTMWYCTSRMVN